MTPVTTDTVTSRSTVTGRGTVIRAVAAHGLAGSMLDLPTVPLHDTAFEGLLADARECRLSGLLWQAIGDGRLPATAEQADRAEWLHVEALSASLLLERLLLETVEVLRAAGVPVRVLKGSAYGHLDYADPAQRTFGDIDLLVPAEHIDDAVAALEDEGHVRLHPQPRPGFDRRFGKGTSFRTVEGLEVDLHRSFSMGPFGVRLDTARLWERSEPFTVGDRVLEALGAEERFVHACYHAALGEVRPRLVPLRDVAQIALTHALDLTRVLSLVRSGRGEAVVARAVRHAWTELDLADVLAVTAWAYAHRADPREAADLAAYGEGSSYATKAIAAVRALPTTGQRLAYLYAMLLPNRGYLGERHAGRWDRLRTGYRQRARQRGAREAGP